MAKELGKSPLNSAMPIRYDAGTGRKLASEKEAHMAPYDPQFKAAFLPPLPGSFTPRPGAFPPNGAFPRMPVSFAGPPGVFPPGHPAARLNFHPGQPFPDGSMLATRFEITERLQEGRCGFVYLARDLAAGVPNCVLKTFDPRRGDSKDEELFRREAALMQTLVHPRIPSGYGLYDHQGMLCASQQFIEGQDLYHYAIEQPPIDEAFATTVMREVLDVLKHLHGQTPPVLHRDLKPENLLLDSSGRIWVIDFGSATSSTRDKHAHDLNAITSTQTLGYASPEQVYGLEAYPASDLYALAATVLYLLSGKNPILLYDGLKGGFALDLPVTPGFKQLLADMLVIPVNERLQTVDQVLERLDGLPKPDAVAPSFTL